MTRETNSVGARRVVEMLLGEDQAVLWTLPIVRNWGFLFLGFVCLVIWLPSKATHAGSEVLLWIATYTVYLFALEILSRVAKRLYDGTLFRLFRIHFNLAMIVILALVAPSTVSSYLWFFFSLPILAAILYFGRFSPLLVIYLEVCTAIWALTFAQDVPTPLDFAAMVAQDAILGLLAAVLYFFVRLFPRIRTENTLLRAATTLMQVLDREELAQLLADAAKAAVSASDAVVVHLLGGEGSRTLVPMGSSHLDLTTLGRMPMEIGIGIAGHAIQSRETINVPDVNKDARYLEPHPSFTPFQSLLVTPMYVSYKGVGTISVHSAKKGAFDARDERFLTTLAAQGATAIANAELYDTRKRRRQQISDILEASRSFGLNQPFNTLLQTIAAEVCRCSGYRTAVVNLLDEASGEIVVRAMAGVPPEGRRKLEGMRIPLPIVKSVLQEEFRIGQSYFIRHDRRPEIPDLSQYTFTPNLGEHKLGEWHQEDVLIVPIQTREEELLGYISVDDPSDRQLPSLDTVQALDLLASAAATAIQNARLYEETDRLRAFSENIVQSMEEGILLEDVSGHITFANRRMAELLGYAPEELIGQHWTVTSAPEERAKVEQETAKRPQGIASRYEAVLLTKEGQRVPAIVSATPLFEEGSFTGVLAAFTDITDRKRQETRLRDYLSTVTSSLAQHTSLEGLYEFIVEAGARFLSARDSVLFLVSDENSETLKLVTATTSPLRGDRSAATSTAISTGPGCGLVAHVAKTAQPIRLVGEEISQPPSWNKEFWTRLGWDFNPEANHSLLAAPMCLPDGRLVGVLVARDAASQEGFTEFDEVLLETLATNAAADIERVRSVEKAREDAVRIERARLETDLHEAMNILATGARWEAEIALDEMERNNSTAARISLTRLQAALNRAYADLRYLLEDLRDPTLEQMGLLVALKKRAKLIGRGRIEVHGDFQERLPPEIEGALYRVGQEALSNAVKHSGVVHDPDVKIELWLERNDGQVRLWVKDNGVGFDVESTLALSRRWGLRRIRDALYEMGGKLDIDSAPGKGTTIRATIDLTRGISCG